jgi:ParB-like chromosome segregation protein Spo0J
MKPKYSEAGIEELRPNPFNPNSVGPANEAKLDKSLEKFGGLFKPIIVREIKGWKDDGPRYEILGGEHRWLSAVRAKLKKVPIFNLGPIDDKTAKEISIADNARYGFDDDLLLADVLASIGTADEIQSFLPYGAADLEAIISSSTIALDELELPETLEDHELPEEKLAKTPRTHTIMRFKVALADAERITERIVAVKHEHGLTTSDDLTNAGDALVQILFADDDT